MEIPTLNQHPLKRQIRMCGLRYWQVSRMLGGYPSGAHLGNMLNGLYKMPKNVEDKIKHIVAEVCKDQESEQQQRLDEVCPQPTATGK